MKISKPWSLYTGKLPFNQCKMKILPYGLYARTCSTPAILIRSVKNNLDIISYKGIVLIISAYKRLCVIYHCILYQMKFWELALKARFWTNILKFLVFFSSFFYITVFSKSYFQKFFWVGKVNWVILSLKMLSFPPILEIHTKLFSHINSYCSVLVIHLYASLLKIFQRLGK